MFDSRQVARTEQRYAARTAERAKTEVNIAAGAILEVDTSERIQLRLERKGIPPRLAAQAVRGEVSFARTAAETPPTGPVLNVLERIIGKDNLIDARFLTGGARAARSVCRVESAEPDGLVAAYGTGVMVSQQLLLTNNHVLDSPQAAAASQVEFDYEVGDDDRLLPSVRFALDPDALFITDLELDYTLVAVHAESVDGRPLQTYAWIPLIEQQGKVIRGEYVNIIQHPNGEPKRVALRENQIIDLLENFLHYKTDTAPGSSGAPVFNDEWELVALHHSGVPAKDPNGNILAIDGGPWSAEMGEHRVKWMANEGARVSRIVRHMRSRSQVLDAAQRQLLTNALEGQGPPLGPLGTVGTRGPDRATATISLTRAKGSTDSDDTSADATATWTIPVEVNVRLGAPIQGVPHIGAPDAGNRSAITPLSGASAVADGQLASALAELERGRSRPYYDEAADEAERDEYYQDVPKRRTRARLFSELSNLLHRTHEPQLRYAPSRHVYPWVDLQPNGMLRSIYTNQEYDPEEFIREDFRIEQERAAHLGERLGAERAMTATQAQEALDLLEARLPYNCEHVVPQSWFEKREPMCGDLHHLFACEARCNSFRRNIPYFEFPEFDEAVRRGCGMAEGNQFEPSHGKGPAARATLYFLLRYPGEINRTTREYEEDRLALLLTWHDQEPPTEYERHRNAAIFAKTGNRNPLIDFPEWAEKIDFAIGLGVDRGRTRTRARLGPSSR